MILQFTYRLGDWHLSYERPWLCDLGVAHFFGNPSKNKPFSLSVSSVRQKKRGERKFWLYQLENGPAIRLAHENTMTDLAPSMYRFAKMHFGNGKKNFAVYVRQV